mgnify:FL=1
MISHLLQSIETGPTGLAWLALLLAFGALAKCAAFFVDSAVSMAVRLQIPRLVVGLVLVSLATTTPELSVSLIAALRGRPEMALGNAVGSVIGNCGVALALCGIFAPRPVPVLRPVFRQTAGVLTAAMVLLGLFVLPDATLGRGEGVVLLGGFVVYLALLVWRYRHGGATIEAEAVDRGGSWPGLVARFVLGVGGVILASRFVVASAITLAHRFGVPEAVIALTLVALGTSIPEIATSVTSAWKGQGALSVGNILGANIMNIGWVAAASAIAHPLTLDRRSVGFMFPAMGLIVAATFYVLNSSAALSRREGFLLLALYGAYLAGFLWVF